MTKTARRVSDLAELSTAERQVVDELDSGEAVVIGDGHLPAHDDVARRVRAALVRLLLLGDDPDHRPHDKGVRLIGAWLVGTLDLEGCRAPRDLGLINCRFEAPPVLRSSKIDSLFLNGSRLPGLFADGLNTTGAVILRGLEASREVRILGAQLGGSLDCKGAHFRTEPDAWTESLDALSADSIKVGGDVFLRGARADGSVRLNKARIVGRLECDGTTLASGDSGVALLADGLVATDVFVRRGFSAYGTVNLAGANISGQLYCSDACFQSNGDWKTRPLTALGLDNANIKGGLFISQSTTFEGVLDLTSAEIGSINDHAQCWPAPGYLLLNRCRYGATTKGPVDAVSRLNWLARQATKLSGQDFWPQPYEQLAKVMREMGHGDDARTVLVEKERLQRAARRAREGNRFVARVLAMRDGLLGILIGYGRRPLRAFAWLAGVWLFGACVFWLAFQDSAMQPAQAGALASEGWRSCAAGEDGTLGGASSCFLEGRDGRSYPPFQPLIYSAETLLPVINFEQRAFWRPNPVPVGGRGWWTRGYLWAHTAAGWALGLLAIAGFSGIVKSD